MEPTTPSSLHQDWMIFRESSEFRFAKAHAPKDPEDAIFRGWQAGWVAGQREALQLTGGLDRKELLDEIERLRQQVVDLGAAPQRSPLELLEEHFRQQLKQADGLAAKLARVREALSS